MTDFGLAVAKTQQAAGNEPQAIQAEVTGCGIASVAAIAGVPYARAKKIANSLGIFARDEKLWSESECDEY